MERIIDPCDLYANWDDVALTSEALEGLEDLVTGLLDHWGYDPVPVEFDDLDDLDCIYNSVDEKIVMDPDSLGPGTQDDAFDCAFHESLHVAQHQSGADFLGSFPELEAQVLSAKLLGEFLADCTSEEVPESGAGRDLPDNPWMSVP